MMYYIASVHVCKYGKLYLILLQLKIYVEGESMMDYAFLNGIYYMPRHLEADCILLQLKHDVFLNGM